MPSDGGYTLITDTTLGSSASSFSLSSIPNTYKHLMLVLVSTTSSGNTDLKLTFNNDTTSTYNAMSNTYNASQANYYNSGQPYLRGTFNDVFTSANNNVTWIDIQDYTMTVTSNKIVRIRSSHNAGARYCYSFGKWEKSSVINSIQVAVLSGVQSWNAGTRCWLYGVNGV